MMLMSKADFKIVKRLKLVYNNLKKGYNPKYNKK